MAKITLHITKEDIQTAPLGNHLQVDTGLIILNFTREAAQELVDDFSAILNPNDELPIESE